MFYPVPSSGTRQKLVPDCMRHVPETGRPTRFLVPVSGKYVMGISDVHAFAFATLSYSF